MILNSDTVTWEAEYHDGTLHKEKEGKMYAGIDRSNLKKFKLMTIDGNCIFETWPPLGKNGHQLIYRRRTSMVQSEGGRNVVFLIGWGLDGPAFVINVDTGLYRELPNGFDPGDPEASPPQPMPGELWLADNM